MSRRLTVKSTFPLALLIIGLVACRQAPLAAQSQALVDIELPAPAREGGMSLTRAIQLRRSVRAYAAEPLTLAEIGQLAWAAQGYTDPGGGKRSAPSAGALYPMELYVLTAEGVFHYRPTGHVLRPLSSEDRRGALAAASLGQASVRHAPAVFVLTAVPQRTAVRYGERATRYIAMEAGHIAQNLLLQAVALELAAVPIGAMVDAEVDQVLELQAGEQSLYVVPVGRPQP